jgi:formylmethanofuran dehydrogenase subunit E
MASFIDKELLEKAVRLHGHLGPFLVLGLKMSLRAKEILGEKPGWCAVETVNCKPYLCAADGIKTVMESDAVTVRKGEGLTVKCSGVNGKEVIIRVKKALVKKYAEGPWEKCEEFAYEVIRSDDRQLFE